MTLLTRHETELKTNAYWVDLMQYTALGEVLAPAKDVSCIADLPAMYEAATVEDLYEVYQQLGLDDGEVFTCVTVAGKEDPALAAAAAPSAAGAAAAAAALGAPVGEGDAGMRTAAAGGEPGDGDERRDGHRGGAQEDGRRRGFARERRRDRRQVVTLLRARPRDDREAV